MPSSIRDAIKNKMFKYCPNDHNAINYLTSFYDNMFDDETVSTLKKIWIFDTGKFILSFRDNQFKCIKSIVPDLGPLGDFIKRYNEWRNSMNKILNDTKYIEYSFNNYPIINKIMISPVDYFQKKNTVKGKRFTVTFIYEY